MTLIANYWQRSECIWLTCEEPPTDGRDTCADHGETS